MTGLREFLFARVPDSNGRRRAYCRFDLALSLPLSIVLVIGLVYTADGLWTWNRVCSVVVAMTLITLVARRPRLVFAIAFGLLACRMAMMALISEHVLSLVAGTVICATVTGSLVRGIE